MYAPLPQAAFEVLIDPKQRAVYDTWAKELQFRCGALRVTDLLSQSCLAILCLHCGFAAGVYNAVHRRLLEPSCAATAHLSHKLLPCC